MISCIEAMLGPLDFTRFGMAPCLADSLFVTHVSRVSEEQAYKTSSRNRSCGKNESSSGNQCVDLDWGNYCSDWLLSFLILRLGVSLTDDLNADGRANLAALKVSARRSNHNGHDTKDNKYQIAWKAQPLQ